MDATGAVVGKGDSCVVGAVREGSAAVVAHQAADTGIAGNLSGRSKCNRTVGGAVLQAGILIHFGGRDDLLGKDAQIIVAGIGHRNGGIQREVFHNALEVGEQRLGEAGDFLVVAVEDALVSLYGVEGRDRFGGECERRCVLGDTGVDGLPPEATALTNLRKDASS